VDTAVKQEVVKEEKVVVTKVDPRTLPGHCRICGKPISALKGEDIGKTCEGHINKLRKYAKSAESAPQGWLRMSLVCRKARAQDIRISAVVNAAGGDACTKPLLDPLFEVTYVGAAKFMHPDVVTKGFAMLKKQAEQRKIDKEAVKEPVKAQADALKNAPKK
jgi:hypothetical protein